MAALPSVVTLATPAEAEIGGVRQVARVSAAFSSKVFATREGLVGGRTANGHVIVQRDWFAALPSVRGLADRGSGNRSVKVCHGGNGRCVFLPVWDVGPWNTQDDFWNHRRQMFKGLPRGKPAAQAAYRDGFHSAKDEFGRRVANPAGIDLADGAFWDGLGLTDNSWVDVTYLWTGRAVRGTVRVPGGQLRVRAKASMDSAVRGYAADYAEVPVECQVKGARVDGTVRTTSLWNRVGRGQYLSHAYIKVKDDWSVPRC